MIYFLFRRRTAFLLYGPILLLFVAKPTPKTLLIGLPFVVAGEAIRIWSSGYLTKLSDLVTAGPFALCRNPLYVGSFLLTIGYLTMGTRVIAWILGLPLFLAFHGGAVIYEERLLKEKFGEPFVYYCKRVPRVVPRLRSLSGTGSFSFARVIDNKEYKGFIGACILVGLFAVISMMPELAPWNLIVGALAH